MLNLAALCGGQRARKLIGSLLPHVGPRVAEIARVRSAQVGRHGAAQVIRKAHDGVQALHAGERRQIARDVLVAVKPQVAQVCERRQVGKLWQVRTLRRANTW